MDIHELFEDAMEEEGLRQLYLDQIHKLCPPEVEGIIYDPNFERSDDFCERLYREEVISREDAIRVGGYNPDQLAMVPMPFKLIGKGKKANIYVRELVFNKIRNHEELLNILLDHEAYHCKQHFEGISLPNCLVLNQSNIGDVGTPIIGASLEIPAELNQHYRGLERRVDFSDRDIFPARRLRKYIRRLGISGVTLSIFPTYDEIVPDTDLEEQIVDSLVGLCQDFLSSYV